MREMISAFLVRRDFICIQINVFLNVPKKHIWIQQITSAWIAIRAVKLVIILLLAFHVLLISLIIQMYQVC